MRILLTLLFSLIVCSTAFGEKAKWVEVGDSCSAQLPIGVYNEKYELPSSNMGDKFFLFRKVDNLQWIEIISLERPKKWIDKFDLSLILFDKEDQTVKYQKQLMALIGKYTDVKSDITRGLYFNCLLNKNETYKINFSKHQTERITIFVCKGNVTFSITKYNNKCKKYSLCDKIKINNLYLNTFAKKTFIEEKE